MSGSNGHLRSVNIAYMTSCREVGLDERIGREVIDPVHGRNYGYREGNLENVARRLRGDRGYNSDLAQHVNLVAVMVDDNEEQYTRAWSQANLWPNLEVPVRDGQGNVLREDTLAAMTFRVPSQPWKDLRLREMESLEAFRSRKAAAKARYEQQILEILAAREADLVVCDSYTTIYGPTMLEAYEGRILNIHPAITQVGNPNRLPGLTPTRDAFTRAVYGWIIVDDKHQVDIPKGPRIWVEYQGEERAAVEVPKSNVTGVTVHVVTERIDNGPVIKCQQHSFPVESITLEAIRDRNYAIKRELLPEAILAYILRADVQQRIEERREQLLANKGQSSGEIVWNAAIG